MNNKTKKIKLIKIFNWIAILTIAHFAVDKILFGIPKPMMDKDIEFYQPKSEADSSLREMNLYMHDKNLISELSIQTGKKTIDDSYMSLLRDYHRQMLELYKIIISKPILMSIDKMSENIEIARKYTNSDQCLLIDGSQDTFNLIAKEYTPLIKKINERPTAIINIHKRILDVPPEKDENGDFSVEGAIERLDIIVKLMEDPYISVRKDNTEALLEINQFMMNFDRLHSIYLQCAQSYNEKVTDLTGYKDAISYLIFLVLTVLVYSKEMLNI